MSFSDPGGCGPESRAYFPEARILMGHQGQSTEMGKPVFITLFSAPPGSVVGWAGQEVSREGTGLGVQLQHTQWDLQAPGFSC